MWSLWQQYISLDILPMKRQWLYLKQIRRKEKCSFTFISTHMVPPNSNEVSMKYKKGLDCAFLFLGFMLAHTKSSLGRLINAHDDVAVAVLW